jgi:PemK-like, MazF-like toxin of type II toxin-antitoxin system
VPVPTPQPGLVIRYAFLWRQEAARGQEEGDKDRPCAVVLATRNALGETVVTVLPITHTPPRNLDLAVEIPASTKQRLGLDDDRSWIVVTDANRFIWPGPDLRPLKPGGPVAYGLLPTKLFDQVRDKLVRAIEAQQAATVPRT